MIKRSRGERMVEVNVSTFGHGSILQSARKYRVNVCEFVDEKLPGEAQAKLVRYRRVYAVRKRTKLYSSFFNRAKAPFLYEGRLNPETGSLYQKMRGLLPQVLEERLYQTEVIREWRKRTKKYRSECAVAIFGTIGIRLKEDGPYIGAKAKMRNRRELGDGEWL